MMTSLGPRVAFTISLGSPHPLDRALMIFLIYIKNALRYLTCDLKNATKIGDLVFNRRNMALDDRLQ